MTPLPQPDVIFTHESDLDGLLAGALLQRLAQKLFGTDIPLEAYHYNFWKQRELRERDVYKRQSTIFGNSTPPSNNGPWKKAKKTVTCRPRKT